MSNIANPVLRNMVNVCEDALSEPSQQRIYKDSKTTIIVCNIPGTMMNMKTAEQDDEITLVSIPNH